MKSDKELFELFRRNEYGLNERPSPNAWRRLERRLDNHQKRQRLNFRRILSMAAALVFIIFIVGLLSIYTKDEAARYDYHTQYLAPPKVEPKMTVHHTQKRVSRSYEYQKKITKSIQEGNPEKKLVPNPRVAFSTD